MDSGLLQKLCALISVHCAVYSENKLLYKNTDDSVSLPFQKDSNFFAVLSKKAEQYKTTPFLYFETPDIYYGGAMDGSGLLYLFGPQSRRTLTKQQSISYRYSHRVSIPFAIPKVSVHQMALFLSLFGMLASQIDISADDIPMCVEGGEEAEFNLNADMEEYQLEQTEEERSHNSMAFENYLMEIVRNGDVDSLQKMVEKETQFDSDEIGKVARNERNNYVYLLLTYIVLMSRAAIEGGLNPEISLQMSDVFMRRVEDCKDSGALQMIGLTAQTAYTEAVHKAKKEKGRIIYIEQAKDYIGKNLRKSFQVSDIADAIGVNRSYLSRKFSQVEGITIQEYIMKERCAHAANLLRYSEYSISEIAAYFSFSSQSHFGREFKKYFHTTPGQYRSEHRNIESKRKGWDISR
jgi:AraC-like DNA-binding protein